jgi:tripartite-type tricarboxylate transporter receptor subunit TctC
MAIFAPAGTPPEIVDKLNREIKAVMQSADIAPALKRFGYQVMTKTPAEAVAFHESELRRMPPILRAAGITAQ